MKKRNAALWAAIALTVLLIAGCSGNGDEENSSNGGVSVSVNEDEKSVTVENANGTTTLSGSNERPELFPEEIPLPDGAVISASLENADKGSSMVTFEVERDFESVVKLYADYVAGSGYVEALPTTSEAESYWFSGNRDQEALVITLNKDLERDGWTSGAVTYQKAP